MSGGVINSRRIAKNTLFLYFRMIIAMGVSLVTTGVTMRVLGQVDFGLNAVLGGIVSMFLFMKGAMQASVSRNITFELGRGDAVRLGRVFNVSLLTFAALSLVVVVLCETVGLWFFYNKMIIPPDRLNAAFWVLQISILTCPLTLTQIPYESVLVAHEDMKMYAYTSMADVLARLAIVYMLIVSPYDKLISLVVLRLVWGVGMLVFYRIYCIVRYSETRFGLCRDRSVYRDVLGFAGADLIGNLSQMAQGQGINLLLNTFFGPTVNAARGIAYSVQGAVYRFCDSFQMAARPQITKSFAAGNETGMWKLVEWSTCVSYFLVWMAALPVCLEADCVLRLWLGSFPAHTIEFLRLVLLLCLLDVLQRPIGFVLHACGHVFLFNVVSGTLYCSAFPLAWFFLRSGLPPESAFASVIVTLLLGTVAEMLILKKYVSYSIPRYCAKIVLRCLFVSLLSAGVTLSVYAHVPFAGFGRVILTTGLAVLTTAGFAFAFGFDREVRDGFVGFVRGKFAAWRKGRRTQ